MIDSTTKRPLYRRIWFWFVIATATPVIWFFVDWKIADSWVKRTVADIRSQGLPTVASELNEYYRVPEGAADTTEAWVHAIDATNVLQNDEEARSLPFVGFSNIPVSLPGEPWEHLDASRTFLRRLSPQMVAIRNAANEGGVARLPLDFSAGILTDFECMNGVHRIARLLELHAHVSVHDHKSNEVLSDILDMFALVDALETPPFLSAHLLRIAMHRSGCDMGFKFANHCKWTEADLARMAAAALTADFRGDMKAALCGDRAFSQEELEHASIRLFVQFNKRRSLQMFGPVIAGLDSDWQVALTAANKATSELDSLQRSLWSKIVWAPVISDTLNFGRAVLVGAIATARQRCFIVSIAVRRFVLREGRLPDSLSDLTNLVPDRNLQNFIDPFNGQSLSFVKNEDGVLIYSVGENLVDDGGSIVIHPYAFEATLDVGLLVLITP